MKNITIITVEAISKPSIRSSKPPCPGIILPESFLLNKHIYNINKKDKVLCAKYRPGHFEGVLAVINQFLLNIKPIIKNFKEV